MAQPVQCLLPSFGPAAQFPKRPVSVRARTTAAQSSSLLSAFEHNSLDSLLKTAWALLLYRYTGLADVCFGYQGSLGLERHPSDAEKLSIFKLTIDNGESIGALLKKSKETTWAEDDVGLSRGPNTLHDDHLPFNTVIMVRVCGDRANGKNSVQPVLPTTLPEEYRARLHVKVLPEEVCIFLEWWNTDVSATQRESVTRYFEHLLEQVLTCEDTTAVDAGCFLEHDWSRVLEFNSVLPEASDRCIHDVIHEIASLHPKREAICAWDGNLTYEELDVLASGLAHHLQAYGVGPEVRVALCFEKSKWHIVAMIGVLKAGGAFVSLDPTHPASRLRSLVDSVDAKIMLCSRNRAGSLSMVVERLIPLDDEAFNKISPPPGGFIQRKVKCDNAAYLIFTSGSTGQPKGTLLDHRAFVSAVFAYGKPLGFHQNCRMLQFAAHTFDASIFESISPLIHGGCVCVPGDEERLNGITQAINSMRINTLCLTPSFIRFIDPSNVPGVHTVILAGEAMSRADLETWSHIKLVNAYGPTEAAICAAFNNKVDMATDCRDIGLPAGVHFWVVDPNDHNRLVPVGAPGELLLEGPTLARCYLNNQQKTDEAFVYNPTWAKPDLVRGDRRFYKTGDLVRYNSDSGSLIFIGRKDTQIKLHGQRIELGEIENHISTLSMIKHALAFLCKSGAAKEKLVAVISLQEELSSNSRSLKLLQQEKSASAMTEIRAELSNIIPTYMIPSVWLCVEALPLLPSGKLDRKEIISWATTQTDNTQPHAPESEAAKSRQMCSSTTSVEDKLASIWSRVLAIPRNKIRLDESFLSMGGDSIAAITCTGYCKKQGMGVTVQDVLQSKSICDLSMRIRQVDQLVEYRESIGEPFGLSPIQKLHFMVRLEGQGYFNQGIRTKLSRHIIEDDLRDALDIVVERHSMLRARLVFANNATAGELRQVITNDSSYRLRSHDIGALSEMESVVAESQSCINAFNGPIMSVDLFHAKDDCFLSMVAHHLVVDIVSWRIILEDLEDVLLHPGEKAPQTNSLPFSTWLSLQEERTLALSGTEVGCRPSVDLGYWGMENQAVTYGDVTCESFELDEDDSHLILMGCHKSLGTEPIDVLLAAQLHSFGQVFKDRSLPVIHNEGHGREVWDTTIDISRTVGWFTTLSPISISSQAANDPVETVILVKDLRRQAVDNGRQQFASLMAGLGQAKEETNSCPMEISFNYVGQHRDLQRQDALFQLMNQMAGETGQGGGASDFGKDTPRFALFEISALAVNGKLRFTFSFSKYMKHQENIRTWIAACGDVLRSLGKSLKLSPPRPTLSDFPMFSWTYPELEDIVSEKLSNVGVGSLDLVEDIYPCSRMQQGILLARSRDSTLYAVHVTYEVQQPGGTPDVERFIQAWRLVVARHAVLRTLFVENLSSRDLFAQVVLKTSELSTVQLSCAADGEVTASGRLFFRLEISHAAMDAMSISIILKDLELAYGGRLDQHRPSFKNYIEYLHNAPQDKSTEYWRVYLEGIKPCLFPKLTDGKDVSQKKLRTLRLNFGLLHELQSVCEEKGLTISTAFTAAWGLTVRLFCNKDDVCFSYMTSLRDAEAKDIESVVGPVINLLACRMRFTKNQKILDILHKVQNDCIEQLPHNSLSFIDIARKLKLPDPALLNTGVSFQKATKEIPHQSSSITFTRVSTIQDPAEYPLFINVVASDRAAEVEMNYWTNMLSDQQAENVFSIYLKYLEDIVHHPREQVDQLETLSDWNKQRIRKWKKQAPEEADFLVHDIVSEKAFSQPESVAISAWDGTLTYTELERLSSSLSAYLVRLGIRTGTPVPIYFTKSVWQIVAILAIFEAGSLCVPMDTSEPSDKLDTWLIEHGAHTALTSSSGNVMLEGQFPSVVTVDKSLFQALPDQNELDSGHIQAYSDAYIVFGNDDSQGTSPIVLSQRAILARAGAFASAVKMTPETRTFQFAPATSDVFLQEVIGTLLHGGCVCIPKSDSPRYLAKSIDETNATFVSLTPSIASLTRPSELPSLQVVALFGETGTEIENVWSGKVQLHSFFGTAECSSTCIQDSEYGGTSAAAFTEASAGCCTWIVDIEDSSRLVPIGCVGELVIEGPGLSTGYLYDDEQTKDKFIEFDSHVTEPKKRPYFQSQQLRRHMFKTGLLARYNSDGTLVRLGSKGPSRSQRSQITAHEVEQFLRTLHLPDYRCVVQGIDLDNEAYPETSVAVYILPTKYQHTTTDRQAIQICQKTTEASQLMLKIHGYLSASLSASQIPDLYFPVQGLPLTRMGVVDRSLLVQATKGLTKDTLLEYDLKKFSEFWLSELETPHGGQLLHSPSVQGPPAPELVDKSIKISWSGSLQKPVAKNMLLCAWAVVLYQYTQNDDIIFGELLADSKGSATHGRPLQVSIFPRRLHINELDSSTGILERIASSVARARPHQNASIAEIRSLNVDTARACNFETVLSVSCMCSDQQSLQLERLEAKMSLHSDYSVCPLAVFCGLEDDGIELAGRYDPRALYRSQVEQLLDLFQEYLGIFQSSNGMNTSIKSLEIKKPSKSLKAFNDTINFWKAYLANVEPCIFPALTSRKSPGMSQKQNLRLSNASKIQTTCKAMSITPKLFLETVWALVLRAYTGLEEACFGCCLPDAKTPVDTLPSRFILHDDYKLRDVVQKRKSDLKQMLNRQMPLSDIHRATKSADSPLFNTAFRHGEYPAINTNLSSDGGLNEYLIIVSADVSGSSAQIHFEYQPSSLSGSDISHIIDCFEFTLNSALSVLEHDGSVNDLEFLGPRSRQALSTWNATLPKPPNKCAHEIFQDQVLVQPSAPAICSWDGDFTYAQLDTLSTRLGYHLVNRGVGQEVFVGMCFEKSSWAVIAQVAVLKAGGAFVALDPSHPESRLQGLVDDIATPIMLCSPRYLKKVSRICKFVLAVDQETLDQIPDTSPTKNLPTVNAENAAYAIFTSGTTGKPKATVIEHVAVAVSSAAFTSKLGYNSDIRSLQFSSYTFDVSVMETIIILMTGGCICIPSDEERLNDLPGAIRRMNANCISCTPSVISTVDPSDIPSIKFVMNGGEKLTESQITRWGDRRFVNAYGPSEATIVATTSLKIDGDGVRLDDDCNSIGTAFSGRTWIVDPHNYNRLLPIGAIGELALEGYNIARGYLNNEKKTKEVFINSPTWSRDQGLNNLLGQIGRIYRTGDLVRYKSDGNISFISRKDTQVKLNGQRIELEEIEQQSALLLPRNMRMAVDVVVPEAMGAVKCLAAFFTREENDTRSVAQDQGVHSMLLPLISSDKQVVGNLHESLGTILPQIMIPRLYFPVQCLPLGATGKLDRKALRSAVQSLSRQGLKPYMISNFGSSEPIEQVPQTESNLRGLWAEALGVEPKSIKAEDSFFGLGGDSFAAMKLVGIARAQDISLTVAKIYEHPTLAGMMKYCLNEQKPADDAMAAVEPFSLVPDSVPLREIMQEVSEQCGVEEGAIADIYPCSALQEGLITLSIKNKGAYVARPVYKLSPNVDLKRFKAAWQHVVDEFDILRTRIVHTDAAGFLQVVMKKVRLSWTFETALENATDDSMEGSGGLLAKYAIVQHGPSLRYFVWTVNHALYDGWSVPPMLKRVEEIYFNYSPTTSTVPYKTFIRHLLQRDLQQSDEFWKAYMSGLSCEPFPPRKTTGQGFPRVVGSQRGSVDLSRVSGATDITIPELIRSAWAIVLSVHTGSGDVSFGETLMGRNIDMAGITEVAGPVVTTVPMRIRVDNKLHVIQYLNDVRQMTAAMIPHQHAGLQRIRKLSDDAALGCNFQNLLVIQSENGGGLNRDIWTSENEETRDDFFTQPLVLECQIVGTKLNIKALHDEAAIGSWQMERLVGQFGFVLEQLLNIPRNSSMTVGGIDVASPLDKRDLASWNQRQVTCVDRCAHDIIREHALMQPQAPAICSWDGELNYQRLFELSSSFAAYLVSCGVGPETFVPICLDKSLWAVVTMISVLIAGGAFVPLDPSHPALRHKEIIEEIGADIILCSPQFRSRYLGTVGTIIPVSKETMTAYSSASSNLTQHAHAAPSNMAYAIFTSGSTGRPKGIIIDHRAICSSIMGFASSIKLTKRSRVLQFASLTFDAAVLEVLGTLMVGGCICVPSEDERLNDIPGAIERMDVSWALLTPSIASILVPSSAPTLKVLTLGGEALSREVVQKWGSRVTLLGAYGPAEASIIGLVNGDFVNHGSACIGYGIPSTLTWVIDPDNHNRLTPLGATGELALEGPTLAREYLKNPEKTAEAFIEDPTWAKNSLRSTSFPRRIYKTGDLVRYNSDGSLEYVGRKDHQVKVNGQRMELGEIEHRLHETQNVRNAVVLLPQTGPLKRRLVVALSLDSLSSESNMFATGACELVSQRDMAEVGYREAKAVQAAIKAHLPVYMVPKAWAVVKSIPMLVSGKLDRKRVTTWLEQVEGTVFDRIIQDFDHATPQLILEEEKPQGGMEAAPTAIREIFAQVLNIPVDDVDPSESFISSGGDSIAGMTVVTKARKRGLTIPLERVLQAKSIDELAAYCQVKTQPRQTKVHEDTSNSFALSPIQEMFLRSLPSLPKGPGRFNQSITVRLTRRMQAEIVEKAVRAAVQKHSMFRARFSKSSDGKWQQRITTDIGSSYTFHTYPVNNPSEIQSQISNTQCSLDVQNGPVFAADLFETKEQQVLFLVASHLCVDVVSWRIVLQDLEDFLETGSLCSEPPLSFQSWCQVQFDNTVSIGKAADIPCQLPDKGFWGMDKMPNNYAHVNIESFILSKDITTLISRQCHNVLRTETIEILLAAVLHSFCSVFTERETPTIYNEGHGREAWDAADPSGTVGWFTTLSPLHVQRGSSLLETMKRVKDSRRRNASLARIFLARNTLHSDSDNSKIIVPLEVTFNYLGQLQQLERDGSIFQHYGDVYSAEKMDAASDMGPETPRFSLFEVSAVIIKERLHFSFTYNRNMRHQAQIQAWKVECQRILEVEIPNLSHFAPEPTLSDYPLLPIDYDGLRDFTQDVLLRAGISHWNQVEDIYPCSPIQEGIIFSQLRDPHEYIFNAIFELCSTGKENIIDLARLRKAWSMVVARHPVLRTMFVESSCKDGTFDQVVLKQASETIVEIECDDTNALSKLDAISLRNNNESSNLYHQLVFCKTSAGRVLMKLEMNHVIMDGGSHSILLKELALAYKNQLPPGPGPLFSDYIKYLKDEPSTDALEYWKKHLSGVRSCHLPVAASKNGARQLSDHMVPFDRYAKLQSFCETNSITFANLILAAWAITLRSYTRSDDVCFGYPSTGRDLPVPGIQDALGIFINTLCCRVKFGASQTLLDISRCVQSDHIRGLAHQRSSLAEIQHALGMQGEPLFNTCVSIQNHANMKMEVAGISYELKQAHDPSEYPLTVNVLSARGHEGILLRYWADSVSESEAAALARAIARVLDCFLQEPSMSVLELNVRDKKNFANTDQHVDRQSLERIVDERVKIAISQILGEGKLASSQSEEANPGIMKGLEKDVETSQQGLMAANGVDPASTTPTLVDNATTNDIEKQLWRLWSTTLELEPQPIKHHYSFFKLGGDSITAMKMVRAARDEGMKLSVADVIKNPVFSNMVSLIINKTMTAMPAVVPKYEEIIEKPAEKPLLPKSEPSKEISVLKPIEFDDISLRAAICPKVGVFKGGIVDVLPVTDFQSLSLTATMFESRWMLTYFYLDGKGSLDIRRLRESFLRVVDAFDILRTVFVCFHGQFFQVVLRKIRPDIFVHETDKSLDEYTGALQQRDKNIHMGQGEQYLQFYVVRKTNSNEHRILMRIHHAQYDGICLPKIMTAIKMAYEGSPISPSSFSNYMRLLPGNITPEHYQHWSTLLKGSKMTEVIRRDRPNTFQHIGRFVQQSKVIEIPSTATENVTVATIMQSAWAITLAKLCAVDDVVFGLTVNGRNGVPSSDNTVGPCLNFIPIRVRFKDRWTALDLFRFLQDQQVANMTHESLGFREIIRRCTDWPDSTFFSTSILHQNVDLEEQIELDNNTYTIGGAGVIDNFSDLMLYSKPIAGNPNQITVSLGYSLKGPIHPSFISMALEMVCDTAQSLVANPNVVLPSPSTLRSLPPQLVEDTPATSGSDSLLLSSLNNRSLSEILAHSDLITRTWQQVLQSQQNTNTRKPQPSFQLDSSFFRLGGDIVNMGQVSWILEQETGLHIRLEDLLAQPTFLGQMALLASEMTKRYAEDEVDAFDAAPAYAPVDSSRKVAVAGNEALTVGSRSANASASAKWSALDKARLMAKKITRLGGLSTRI
ncbi:hypothetical protein BDV18DRAFT_157379 [Aspergillus unguis]